MAALLSDLGDQECNSSRPRSFDRVALAPPAEPAPEADEARVASPPDAVPAEPARLSTPAEPAGTSSHEEGGSTKPAEATRDCAPASRCPDEESPAPDAARPQERVIPAPMTGVPEPSRVWITRQIRLEQPVRCVGIRNETAMRTTSRPVQAHGLPRPAKACLTEQAQPVQRHQQGAALVPDDAQRQRDPTE